MATLPICTLYIHNYYKEIHYNTISQYVGNISEFIDNINNYTILTVIIS